MTRATPICAATLALALAGAASAGTAGSAADCAQRAQLAERIMRHRQDTDDLESTWRIAANLRDPQLSRFGQRLVYEAYQRPRRVSEDDRARAIREFTEEARATCVAQDEGLAPGPTG